MFEPLACVCVCVVLCDVCVACTVCTVCTVCGVWEREAKEGAVGGRVDGWEGVKCLRVSTEISRAPKDAKLT